MTVPSRSSRRPTTFQRRASLLPAVVAAGLLVLGLIPGLTPGSARAEQAGSAVNRAAAGSLEMGFNHSCVVLTTGAVRCWGKGRYGQLGHNSTAAVGNGRGKSIKAAGNVPVGAKVTAIAAAKSYTCALLAAGAVRCWGNGSFGELGHDSTAGIGNGTGRSIKAAGNVPLGGKATAITAGGKHTCALMATGAVRCWGQGGALGYGSTASVGDGTGLSIQAAGDVPLGGRATAISAGYLHTCALMSGGSVRCWGYNDQGQLGYGNTTSVGDGSGPSIRTAGNVPVGGKVVAISAGMLHTCALLATGSVRCWGLGGNGQLGYDNRAHVGNGHGRSIRQAGDVPLGGKAIAITADGFHTCALMATHAVRCWGRVGDGLGYNSLTDIGDGRGPSIKQAGDVPLGGKAAAISAGLFHTCAVLRNGAVRCWGYGRYGKLGHNSTRNVGDFGEQPIRQAGNVPVGAAVRTSAR